MNRTNTLPIGLVVAAIALGGGMYIGYGRQQSSSPETNRVKQIAIDQLFASHWQDADGQKFSFAQWRGKTVVVNFWATWCPPCRDEIPGFSRLQKKYAANDVQFVGIALDTPGNVQEFTRTLQVDYPLPIGASEGTELARALGNVQLALPYTIIVAPNGEARWARLGLVSEQELDNILRQMSAS